METALFDGGAVVLHNTNHLVGHYEGCDGLKTGFTNGAGFCLAATAERASRRIIVVVMDCPDSRDRDLKVVQLLQRGFSTTPFVGPTISSSHPASAGPAPAPVAPGGSPVIKFVLQNPGF